MLESKPDLPMSGLGAGKAMLSSLRGGSRVRDKLNWQSQNEPDASKNNITIDKMAIWKYCQ